MAVVVGFLWLAAVAVFIGWPLLGRTLERESGGALAEDVQSRQAMLSARFQDLEADHAGLLVGDEEYAATSDQLQAEIKTLQQDSRLLGMILGVLLLAARPAVAQLPAEVGGSITGRMVAADKSISLPQSLDVELHPYRKGKAGPTFSTSVDGEGRFKMDGLLLHPDIRYWFSVKLNGVTYYSNVVALTNQQPQGEVQIPIYPIGDSPAHLHFVLDHSMMKVEARSADVLDFVAVEQQGDEGYSGGSDGGVVVPLPVGFSALEQVEGSQPVMEAPGKGALIAGPLPPGRTVVAFSYRLPTRGDSVDFVRRWGLAVDRFGVFLQDTGITFQGHDMIEEGPKTVDDKPYHVWARTAIPANGAVIFSLSNLPRARDWRPWYATGFGTILLCFFIGSLRK